MWTELFHIDQLDRLAEASHQRAQVIFKHSTRCSISRVALSRFDRATPSTKENNYYLLDLLEHRSISNAIAERFGVMHESPQVLIIQHGKSIYDASHLDIEPAEISERVGSSGSESL